jgi:large subunit ribosomal protein L24
MQRIKKGDTVELIAGKDLGGRGEVLVVDNKKGRITVSGLNVMKRHQKARQLPGGSQVPAQILDFNAPIHESNVMVVCPACDAATRVGFRVRDDGYKVRVCKKCGADIV